VFVNGQLFRFASLPIAIVISRGRCLNTYFVGRLYSRIALIPSLSAAITTVLQTEKKSCKFEKSNTTKSVEQDAPVRVSITLHDQIALQLTQTHQAIKSPNKEKTKAHYTGSMF